jgi:hypothetical protein
MAAQTTAKWVTLGPGDVTIQVGTGGTATSFACEFANARVLHEYEDVGDARTMLCGQKRAAGKARYDGFGGELENDLSAAGLYKFLMDNDLEPATVSFIPNTDDGAQWVISGLPLTLPEEIGADEFGAVIVSEVEWTGGTATFTPSTEPAADGGA